MLECVSKALHVNGWAPEHLCTRAGDTLDMAVGEQRGTQALGAGPNSEFFH